MDEEGFARGNADELFRFRDQLADFDPDVVLVMSADHVYRLDYRDVLDTHREAGAEATLVTTGLPPGCDAGDHAVVQVSDDGTVERRSATSPTTSPTTDRSSSPPRSIAYDPEVLREVLEELHRETAADSDEGDTGLGDFGDLLVPRLVERGRTVAHHHDGYWRDLGQPHHYLRAHHEILTDDVDVLSMPGWPVLSRLPQRVPARVLDGGVVVDSLLSPGVRVAGRVERSVLGPGVVVEAGALVADSVVFADTVVRAGAEVHWSVVDVRCVVEPDARVGDRRRERTRGPRRGHPRRLRQHGRAGRRGSRRGPARARHGRRQPHFWGSCRSRQRLSTGAAGTVRTHPSGCPRGSEGCLCPAAPRIP